MRLRVVFLFLVLFFFAYRYPTVSTSLSRKDCPFCIKLLYYLCQNSVVHTCAGESWAVFWFHARACLRTNTTPSPLLWQCLKMTPTLFFFQSSPGLTSFFEFQCKLKVTLLVCTKKALLGVWKGLHWTRRLFRKHHHLYYAEWPNLRT